LLHSACFFGNLKAIKALVEIFGADVNQTDYRG
jgi:ankyrin repeat protein